jgi:hypothetical protein
VDDDDEEEEEEEEGGGRRGRSNLKPDPMANLLVFS